MLADGRLLGVDRLPTRGRKGSAESLRGAAALVRRLERRHGWRVDEARIAPLRAVDTTTLTVPAIPPSTGRLRLLAAGVATPGGSGSCVGVPLWLDSAPQNPPTARPFVAVVPPGLGYARAAELLRGLAGAGVPIEAVLVASDEGVLIANRIDSRVPVIDQVDVSGVAACPLVAVEVRAPGQPLTLLTDPVALAAAFALGDAEAADAVTLSRSLVDYSNAVIGLAESAAERGSRTTRDSHGSRRAESGSRCGKPALCCRAGRSVRSPATAPGHRANPAPLSSVVGPPLLLEEQRGPHDLLRPGWTTCSRWTWPPWPTWRRRGGAAWAGRSWPRRWTAWRPEPTTRASWPSCSAAR